MERVRVASLQYQIRPVRHYEDFQEQTEAWIRNAAEYKAQVVLFPEYFTLQLLALGNLGRPLPEQIKDVARLKTRFVEFVLAAAKKHGIYIVAGSIPAFGSEAESAVQNECHFFGPSGTHAVQGKLHMTRFEKEDFLVSSLPGLKVFETDFGKIAISICYDVEFPEIARACAKLGARILFVPSCTDDRQGYLRVRTCAQARTIENQMYVVQSCTVGGLIGHSALALNYGQAAIFTPSDYGFARDGVLAEGVTNQEWMVVGDLDLKLLEESWKSGTVLPLQDSVSAESVTSQVELVRV